MSEKFMSPLAKGTPVRVKQWKYGFTPGIDGSGGFAGEVEVYEEAQGGGYWVRKRGSDTEDKTTMRQAAVVEVVEPQIVPGDVVRIVKFREVDPEQVNDPSRYEVFEIREHGGYWLREFGSTVTDRGKMTIADVVERADTPDDAKYTQDEVDRQIRAAVFQNENRLRSEARQQLEDFKESVAEKAMSLADEHDWCEVVQDALGELGIDVPDQHADLELTVRVRLSAVSTEFRQRAKDGDRDWIASSLTVDVTGDNDCGEVELADTSVTDVSLFS